MSSIDNAKKGMSWKHPNERAGCSNCKHVAVESPSPGFINPNLRCVPGGFYTLARAICNNWADAVGVRG